MKNSDEAVERVLAGLREAEAPEGMERRILEAMRGGASERRPMRLGMPWGLIWTRGWMPVRARSWAVGLASVMVVSSVVGWSVFGGDVFRGHGMGHEGMAVKRYAAPAEEEKAATRVEGLRERSSVRWRGGTNARRVGRVRERGLVALDERGVGNHPAPEAPLTDEEKLLLRIAHKGDRVEMAALNPLLQASRDAEEKADVKKFFGLRMRRDNE
jgi:hypothetical protein